MIFAQLTARPCWQLVKIHPQGSRVRTSTPSSEKVPARPARNLQAFSTRVSLRATLSRDRNLSSLRCFGARRGGVCSDPARTPTELGARKKPDPPAAPAAGPPSPAVPPPPPPTQPSKPSKPSQVPIHGTGGLWPPLSSPPPAPYRLSPSPSNLLLRGKPLGGSVAGRMRKPATTPRRHPLPPPPCRRPAAALAASRASLPAPCRTVFLTATALAASPRRQPSPSPRHHRQCRDPPAGRGRVREALTAAWCSLGARHAWRRGSAGHIFGHLCACGGAQACSLACYVLYDVYGSGTS